MHTRRTPLLAALGAALSAVLIASPLAANAADAPGKDKPGHYGFAVIGDVPYGAAQIEAFPGMVDRINAEPGIDLAFHVGDIKDGSSPCTDEYNAMIKAQFDRFEAPLVYTPGDNEWTDCHRPSAGGYEPLERLAAVRATFFATPGRTLGVNPITVDSQSDLGIPENVSLRRQGLAIATLHIIGSNNGLAPWTGLTTPQPAQLADEQARTDAAVALVRETFEGARQRKDRAVVLFQQADMFNPTVAPKPSNTSAFTRLIQAIVDESSAFEGEVYLIDGDSHLYHVDQPVAAGSPWLAYYGIVGAADNLTRITVDGEQQNVDFLKVTVNRPGAEHVLSWERIPYDSSPTQ